MIIFSYNLHSKFANCPNSIFHGIFFLPVQNPFQDHVLQFTFPFSLFHFNLLNSSSAFLCLSSHECFSRIHTGCFVECLSKWNVPSELLRRLHPEAHDMGMYASWVMLNVITESKCPVAKL